jgi:hypothetical protein
LGEKFGCPSLKEPLIISDNKMRVWLLIFNTIISTQ